MTVEREGINIFRAEADIWNKDFLLHLVNSIH